MARPCCWVVAYGRSLRPLPIALSHCSLSLELMSLWRKEHTLTYKTRKIGNVMPVCRIKTAFLCVWPLFLEQYRIESGGGWLHKILIVFAGCDRTRNNKALIDTVIKWSRMLISASFVRVCSRWSWLHFLYKKNTLNNMWNGIRNEGETKTKSDRPEMLKWECSKSLTKGMPLF